MAYQVACLNTTSQLAASDGYYLMLTCMSLEHVERKAMSFLFDSTIEVVAMLVSPYLVSHLCATALQKQQSIS